MCVRLLLVNGIELVSEQLVHREHVDLVLLEDGVHLFVAQDLALVIGILQAVALDVDPELLDHLRAGQLVTNQHPPKP